MGWKPTTVSGHRSFKESIVNVSVFIYDGYSNK